MQYLRTLQAAGPHGLNQSVTVFNNAAGPSQENAPSDSDNEPWSNGRQVCSFYQLWN
jgi:hypothetical protein